ncbi:MAG: type 4a pilus biogenesis protein PilO [Myxococcota bacterium]
MNQFVERFAKLPRSQRGLVAVLSYLFIAVGFYFSLISPTLAAIDTAEAVRRELTVKRDQVRARAENRAAFEAELEELASQLKEALKELPNDREIPGLLSEIDGLARKSGLDVRKFQPLPEAMHEYYADVPVQIVMDGGYHEVGIFFDRVSKMDRIVSVRNIEMSNPRESGSEVNLTVSGQVVTYRFLTDAEIQAQRDKARQKPGGPAGGGE